MSQVAAPRPWPRAVHGDYILVTASSSGPADMKPAACLLQMARWGKEVLAVLKRLAEMQDTVQRGDGCGWNNAHPPGTEGILLPLSLHMHVSYMMSHGLRPS